ncbi:MAG: hypothetical protein HY747_02150 [Elusimicrobia bacterium]|nr:hypothetical protein [Elusimicrobiota bacterium]
MNEKDAPFKLCFEVLKRLHKSGALQNMVLIRSWCFYFYRDYFKDTEDFSTLRTRDIDFLIATPSKIKSRVDIPSLLADLGFVVGMYGEGHMRLEHPELIIDFLVPEKGKGGSDPRRIRNLGVNAQPLRFLTLLLDNTVAVVSQGIEMTLPHPINYGLHKLIVSNRRTKADKKAKDRQQALEILRAVLKSRQTDELTKIFKSLPGGWQKKIIAVLNPAGEKDILAALG